LLRGLALPIIGAAMVGARIRSLEPAPLDPRYSIHRLDAQRHQRGPKAKHLASHGPLVTGHVIGLGRAAPPVSPNRYVIDTELARADLDALDLRYMSALHEGIVAAQEADQRDQAETTTDEHSSGGQRESVARPRNRQLWPLR